MLFKLHNTSHSKHKPKSKTRTVLKQPMFKKKIRCYLRNTKHKFFFYLSATLRYGDFFGKKYIVNQTASIQHVIQTIGYNVNKDW